MEQKEKELVIKDLCGRLPYGVVVQVNDAVRGSYDRRLVQVFCDRVSCSVNVFNPLKECICIDSVKPYLRPMSSMTDEEEDEYEIIIRSSLTTHIDWLNKNMFDYRGLIPKGLALEAEDGMYNN